MAMVVKTQAVTSRHNYIPSRYQIKAIQQILQKQGLIEPLLVYPNTLEVGRRVWDHERLIAAYHMGWDTVIVTDGKY